MKNSKILLWAGLICCVAIVSACGCANNRLSSGSVEQSSQVPVTVSDSSQPVDTSSSEEEAVTEPIDKNIKEINYGDYDDLSGESVPWGPGVQQDKDGKSTACLDLQKKYSQYDCNFILPESDNVILSFDEGYENGYTATILDILKEKDVKAIFFITGHYLNTAPDLVGRMIDEGHIVGSHSFSHIDYTSATAQECFEDTKKLHDAVLDKFDYQMTVFRYPEGKFSEKSLKMINDMGYKAVFWSFGYKDWDPKVQMSQEDALNKIKKFVHKGEIMLLHPVGETNSLILDELIDYLHQEGYTVGPPENFGTVQIEN